MRGFVYSVSAILVCGLLVFASVTFAKEGEELIEQREGHDDRPAIIHPTDALIRQLKLPEGFRINIFAKGLGAPRMLAVADDGTVYVTRRDRDDVLALEDRDGDGKAEKTRPVVKNMPGVHGIAIRDHRMYLATVNEVYVAEIKKGSVGEPKKILGGLPPGGRHPNRTLGLDPQGMLYITVGSTCNCCLEPYAESATILRAKADGSDKEIFATGLRNTLGIGWHPVSKEMYGMDNGTDWLGDGFPPEELNKIEKGKHYGWPFVYGDQQLIDLQNYPPGFDPKAYLAKSTPPVLEYQAHNAPLQLVFYTGSQFPQAYRNDAFVAMHGSWNRKPPTGYKIVRVKFSPEGKPLEFQRFVTGFLNKEGTKAFARPAGIAVAKDGSLLFSCDKTGVIYRVSYKGR